MNLVEFIKEVPVRNTSEGDEVWLPITQYAVPDIRLGCYYISNKGRVYSFIRNKLLTPQITNCGYYRVPLRLYDGKQVYCSTHRLVMLTFEWIPDYIHMQVNHVNGDKGSNYYDNLEWCTPSENILHSHKLGMSKPLSGEDASNSTITNDQAEQICQMIVDGLPHKEISRVIGCETYIVNNISAGNTWKYYYNKYDLQRYKRTERLGFSDDELNTLCKYFEDNGYKYTTNSELYRNALIDLFNIEYTNSMSATMSRIYNKKTRYDITSKYKY